MHSALALLPVLIVVPLAAFLLPVLLRLMKPSQTSELTAEWFESFHASFYQPMGGLLAREDFEFLSRQPGFDRRLVLKLRQDRLRIFRGYLNRLIVDFNRLYSLSQLVISQNSEDHSAIFSDLLTLRLRFRVSIMQVEFSYLMCRWGMSDISVGKPIQRMEEMSRRLTSLPQFKSLLAN